VNFWLLPTVTLLLSCTKIGSVAEQGMAPAGAPELVRSRRWYESVFQWERSPWYRWSDSWSEFPVHVVISTSGRACVTDQGGYHVAVEGTLFYCRTPWRYPR
jgi:hypothetical protein